MQLQQFRSRPSHDLKRMANHLGWFSLALGAAELIAPRTIKKWIGTPGPKILLQACGLREIASGVFILLSTRPVSVVWARLAGDILDAAFLVPTLRRRNRHRIGGKAAMAFVLAATALDFWVAAGRR
jgi:hypothetical protein